MPIPFCDLLSLPFILLFHFIPFLHSFMKLWRWHRLGQDDLPCWLHNIQVIWKVVTETRWSSFTTWTTKVVSLKWSVVVVDVILGISHTVPAPCENFVRESCADVISADDAIVLMLQSIQCRRFVLEGHSSIQWQTLSWTNGPWTCAGLRLVHT